MGGMAEEMRKVYLYCPSCGAEWLPCTSDIDGLDRCYYCIGSASPVKLGDLLAWFGSRIRDLESEVERLENER